MREHNDFDLVCEVKGCKNPYFKEGLCSAHFKSATKEHEQRIAMGQPYGRFSNEGIEWKYGYLYEERNGEYGLGRPVHWSVVPNIWYKYFEESV